MGVMKERKIGQKARNSGPGNRQQSKVAFSELRFVRIGLTAEEKEEFLDLLADGRFSASPFDDWLANGYSFKLKLQDGGKSCLATLTCDRREHVCGGGVLSAYAGDATTAIALLRYKDEVLAGEHGWFEAEATRSGSEPDIG